MDPALWTKQEETNQIPRRYFIVDKVEAVIYGYIRSIEHSVIVDSVLFIIIKYYYVFGAFIKWYSNDSRKFSLNILKKSEKFANERFFWKNTIVISVYEKTFTIRTGSYLWENYSLNWQLSVAERVLLRFRYNLNKTLYWKSILVTKNNDHSLSNNIESTVFP